MGEAELLALDADCVLWMGKIPEHAGADVDELCRILASGKNLISLTHLSYLTPERAPAELVSTTITLPQGQLAAIEAACREGNSSFYTTGIEPGFVSEVLAPTLTSLCSRIDYIETREIVSYDAWASEANLSVMPFGKEPGKDDFAFLAWLQPFFEPNINLIADAISAEIDEITSGSEVVEAPEDFNVAAGTIRKGTIAAIRFRYTGLINGRAKIRNEHITTLRRDLVEQWMGGRNSDYDVRIEGEPSLYLGLDFSDDADRRPPVQIALFVTGMRALNAAPAVCEAEPGIVTAAKLPNITGVYTMAR